LHARPAPRYDAPAGHVEEVFLAVVHRGAILALIVFVLPASAHAAGYITPFLGFNFGGDSANCIALTNCQEKRANWGVSAATIRGVVGFEQELAYAPDFFGQADGESNGVLTVMTNVLVIIPAGRVNPYGLIGVGLIRPHVKLDAASLAVDKNAVGWDIGGGVNVFLTNHLGVRGDVRHIKTMKDVSLGGLFSTEQLDFWRASVGLTFRF